MMKINMRVTPLNLVMALGISYASYVYVLSPSEHPVTHKGNIVVLSDEVHKDSVVSMSKRFDALVDAGAKKVLVKIMSFGGSVFDGREFSKRMDTKGIQVDTFSDNYFMSMGMDFFMNGHNRIVTKDALGLIHRGSAGGMSYYDLKLKLKDVQEELLKKEEDKRLGVEEKEDKLGGLFGSPKKTKTLGKLKHEENRLLNTIHMMDKLFEPTFKRLEEIKKTAPNPEMTQGIIDLMKIGAADLTLNADELLASGIATQIVDDINDADYSGDRTEGIK